MEGRRGVGGGGGMGGVGGYNVSLVITTMTVKEIFSHFADK